MSDVLTNARNSVVAIALNFAKSGADGVFEKLEDDLSALGVRTVEGLKKLEEELVTSCVCTIDEAAKVIHKLCAIRFARQYPPEILESIQKACASEAKSTLSH
ncbi:hypothetical protein IPH92_04595 [Candidatus Kaiserbacteria bacterium]|nr:MAG: hypothetical protein IPH92_04595 [Candidatus Kaiserbacteria bacterium]